MSRPAIGLFLPTMARSGEPLPDVAAAARHAEALGYESVWAVDQLVAGTGVPLLESTVALAVAAGATRHLRLGFGVMVVPLRPPVWIAKQVASLQVASAGRVLLGVGVGGDRHVASWVAAAVPARERGRRTDDALAVVPDLIAGRPVDLGAGPVALAPRAPVPPIVVGGMADAALARAVAHDGWFAMPVPPEALTPTLDRLEQLAATAGRPRPPVTGSVTVALDGDPELPPDDRIVELLVDPDGVYGMPAEAVPGMLVRGTGEALAERVDALARLGAERVVLTLAAGRWSRQAELAATALGLTPSSPEPAIPEGASPWLTSSGIT